ncbi:MAG TPA: hypothetical protein VKN99_11415, partial [Polyangia bacterium]|nr:hypothetical protein [Polyangia bacterium]
MTTIGGYLDPEGHAISDGTRYCNLLSACALNADTNRFDCSDLPGETVDYFHCDTDSNGDEKCAKCSCELESTDCDYPGDMCIQGTCVPPPSTCCQDCGECGNQCQFVGLDGDAGSCGGSGGTGGSGGGDGGGCFPSGAACTRNSDCCDGCCGLDYICTSGAGGGSGDPSRCQCGRSQNGCNGDLDCCTGYCCVNGACSANCGGTG